MFFHVFAQTTHVVTAPHGFACVVIPAARLYIPSFIEIRSGVSEPQGVKIWLFPLLWLVAFTTACTTVQAVIYLSARTSQEPRVQTSLNFLYILPLAVTRYFSQDNAIRCVPPVLWMTSCFRIMENAVGVGKTCVCRQITRYIDGRGQNLLSRLPYFQTK